MKTITINYLSHNRLDYSNLMFYFLSKIKPENKLKLKLNVLATHDNDWVNKCDSLGIEYTIHVINAHHNYLNKIRIAISTDTEYSVKLDEDCFINNYVWDYLIENVDILNNDEVLTLAPTMSNNIPSCDFFINDFIDDFSVRDIVYKHFLNRPMPNGLWSVDYTPLNQFTINATEWEYNKFYEGLNSLNTITKGIHPLRISYEAQMEINNYILKNIDKFTSDNNYELFEIHSPYFTNSMFFIKTSEWVNILSHPTVDEYDEIALNKYKRDNNKKFLFVKNGFGIHPMFNTVYGNQNPWGIGGENGEQDEINFYNNLSENIIKYDTLYR
jgi:hypothetical protein